MSNFISKIVLSLLPSSVSLYFMAKSRLEIINNIAWLFSDKMFRMIVGLIVGIWLARYLGPQQYGILSYAQSLVTIFATIAALGLDNVVIRDLVRKDENTNLTLGSTFFLKLFGGIIAATITNFSVWYVRPDDILMRLVVAVISLSIIAQCFDTIDFWFRAHVRSKYTVIAKNVGFSIISIVKIIFIIIKAPVEYFAYIIMSETLLGAIGLLVAYHLSRLSVKKWRLSMQRCISLLKESWPLIFSSLVVSLYMRVDQILLGEFVGSSAVGVYAVATRISEVWYFVPTAIVSSIMPSIISSKDISEELYYGKIQKLFKWMALLSVSIAIVFTVIAKPLILFLFGTSYEAAGLVLAMHIWATPFVFLGVACNPWVITEGMMKFTLVTAAIGAVLNIAVNLLLIPRLNVLGPPIAIIISQMFVSYIAYGLTNQTRQIFFMQTRALVSVISPVNWKQIIGK